MHLSRFKPADPLDVVVDGLSSFERGVVDLRYGAHEDLQQVAATLASTTGQVAAALMSVYRQLAVALES